MKKTVFIFLLLILYLGLFAQQEPQFTQYMFNEVSVNPAASGASGAVCLAGIGRSQWIGYEDDSGNVVNPRTIGLAFDMPVYSIKSGVGLTFQYGRLGAEKNTDLRLLYAYHHVLKNKHMLSFGLSFGILSKTIDYSQLQWENDPSLDGNSKESGVITDIGLGVHYKIPKKLYAGFAVKNLLGSSAEIGSPEFKMARHYYLYGGYDFKFIYKKNHTFILTPGLMVKAVTGSVKVDINAIVTYDNFVWGGIVYRVENAIGIMAGVNYKGFSLGVAYDYTLNSVFSKGNRSSAEIFLKYCYPIYPAVIKKSGYNTRNL